jgi:hypothetical protein
LRRIEERLGIAVINFVLRVLRRDAHPDPLSSHRARDCVHYLQQDASSVFDAATVLVGTLVRAVAQELIDEVAVSRVHFDTVESRGHRVLRGIRVLEDDATDLIGLKSPRPEWVRSPFS